MGCQLIAIGLSVVADLVGEWLGEEALTKRTWFDRLSTEHSGFSVRRIVVGVMVVLLSFSLIISVRLAFLSVFH
jgi:hypothetical protein